MVKGLDVATQGAIRDRSRQVPRSFIVIRVKALVGGAEVVFCFTDFGEDVITNVVDGNTLQLVSHTFYGDAAPIQRMDPMPLKIGLDAKPVDVVLNSLHPVVKNMVFNHDCRNAKVEIYRGRLDPESMLLVAAPRSRKIGQINGAPRTRGAIGGVGSVTLAVVGSPRVLTVTSSALRSDETQRLRGGDRARRYGGTAFKWPYSWGELKSGQKPAGPPPRQKFLGIF